MNLGIQVLSFARDPRGSKAHKGKIDHDLGLLEEATDSLMSDVQEKPIHKEILKQKTTVLSSAGDLSSTFQNLIYSSHLSSNAQCRTKKKAEDVYCS